MGQMPFAAFSLPIPMIVILMLSVTIHVIFILLDGFHIDFNGCPGIGPFLLTLIIASDCVDIMKLQQKC